jgi:hypothetical protein
MIKADHSVTNFKALTPCSMLPGWQTNGVASLTRIAGLYILSGTKRGPPEKERGLTPALRYSRSMERIEYIQNVANIWADLDGCEGGDLLRALSDVLGMAHYSYADERTLEAVLEACIQREIQVMHADATGEDPDAYGYEPERVEQALAQIADLRQQLRYGGREL